jgi:diguanylate cyclase (GGDEF)-like protein/PAS domain S-box-containing protein
MTELGAMLSNPLSVVLLATAIAVGAMGTWVMARERGSDASFPFFALCTLATLWLAGISFTIGAASPQQALGWARMSFLAVPLLPVAILHFSARLLGLSAGFSAVAAALWWVGIGFVLLAQGTDRLLTGVLEHPWGFYPRLSSMGWLLVGVFVAAQAATLVLFWRRLRSPVGEPDRRRARAFFLAFLLACVALVDFLPSFGRPILPLGFLGVLAFLLLAGRAIWRHRLVDLSPSFAATKILETMQGAVLVVDRDDRVQVANQAAAALLGATEEQLLGTDIRDLVETPANVGRSSGTLVRGGTIRDRVMIWKRRDGQRVEVSVSASLLRDELGVPVAAIYVATDISERKRAKQIEYQAYHDSLTGLPNRIALRQRLDRELELGNRCGRVLAILFLDLDGFKLINDSLGHGVGDRLLQALSLRLKACLRSEDLVSRFGGDEFVAVVDLARPADCEIVGRKLLQAVAEPFVIEGHELFVTASIGGALHPHHGDDPEALVKNADSAMYLAKELGKNNLQLFGHAIHGRARRRLSMESRLRRALERDELELRYQPIVELATGKVIAAEALLRWRLDGRLLLPAEFMEVAEEARLVGPIGEWALATACSEAARWRHAGRDVQLAINLSPSQLRDFRIVEVIDGALHESGLEPSALELEITESAAMESAQSIVGLLTDVKALGVSLAIDDFGTGYSSLSYLQRFPIDLLKIDQSFVQGIGQQRGAGAIIKATMSMADALGLEVTAEGVESVAQVDFLTACGCRRAQGFLFSRPLVPERLEQYLVKTGDQAASA